MNILRNILSACVLTAVFIVSAAIPDLPRVMLHGTEYYYYDVKKGESIYKVAKTLGVKTSDITEANPQALDGLRAGMRLYIPVGLYSAPVAEVVTQPATSGDGMTAPTDDAVSESVRTAVTTRPKPHNPSFKNDTPATVKPAEAPIPQTVAAENHPEEMETVTHKVKRGESLYGIAREAGMTMDDVIRLNPHAAYGVAPGDELTLLRPKRMEAIGQAPGTEYQMPPVDNDYSLAESERRISETMVVPVISPEDSIAPVDTLNIAILLPFMLADEEPSMQAKLFTEFYEGFLLAARKLNDAEGVPHITIHAYDTSASIDTVNALMRKPEVFNANVIIAPDNDAQIAAIAQQMSPDTYLFNAFNVKSRLYQTYPNIIQANIPHGDLYTEAVGAFINLFPGSTPVFLSRIDGQADKDAFVSGLKERLENDTCRFVDITFRNLLSTKDLAGLQDSVSYVFVPVSGQRAEFAKITEAIRRFSESRPGIGTYLFGYPEWITFRGEYFNRLGENNATIYTRFYAAPDEPQRKALEQEFKDAYGTEMLDAAPVQGILGYDTGVYIITTLRENRGDFRGNPGSYIGIQSAYEFQDLVNRAIFIVRFGPNGYVDKIPLI